MGSYKNNFYKLGFRIFYFVLKGSNYDLKIEYDFLSVFINNNNSYY